MAESEQMPAGKTGRSDITGLIKTEKKIYPQIYDYELPNRPEMRGMQKVGYTERRDVESRIREQVNTAGLHEPYRLLWSGSSVWPSTGADQHHSRYFKDKDLHRYFKQRGVQQFKPTDRDDRRDEWFDFSLNPSLSRQLFEEFKSSGGEPQHQGQKAAYQLRPEQEQAIRQTLAYAHANQTTDFANPNPRAKYLWNAKPRFGKTLSTYDFAKRFKAHNVLIITNRPAIADSWYGDYDKFIGGYNFISTTGTLKDRQVMSYEQYANCSLRGEPIIAFLSMQDLKGAAIFGGKFNKLQWVADVIWDLLVIDEAHEGVDTARTDAAFSHINRRFTLHLSGTPFKAIANDYFSDDQIYNWTYADEQRVKAAELAAGNEAGSHVNLPRMNLYTYKMSELIADRLEDGTTLDDGDGTAQDCAYSFDLNEMFSVQGGYLKHESEVKTFLNQLTTNTKYPFSTPELRKELRHTFWLVGNRVASVHALAKLLREHPVFKDYEIIEAVGKGGMDGDDGDEESRDIAGNEKSLAKVRAAIARSDRTITLSVGQLTTGVTVKEWSAVLMLSGVKSESLYMQALFRAQNPFSYRDPETGELHIKTDAYVFDFSPDRVLEIYDKFANGLSAAAVAGRETKDEREDNIQELLNYFPVLAEDRDGQMVSLDANQVLTFPNAIRAQQVVNQRFISNLLFENITSVFNIPTEVTQCLNKVRSTDDSGSLVNRPECVEHDPERHNKTQQRISVNRAHLLGDRIYGSDYDKLFSGIKPAADMTEHDKDVAQTHIVAEHMRMIDEPLAVYKEVYAPTDRRLEAVREKQRALAVQVAADYVDAKITAPEAARRLEAAVREDLPNDTVVKEEEAQEQKEDNDEMSQIRAKLRTFARAIPSMLMAAADPGSLTIDNIEDSVDDATFEELFTETSGKDAADIARFTKADFRMIRGPWRNPETGEEFAGFFNKYTFNAAIQEFNQKRRDLANYLNSEEDIFSYIAPLRTNQIFTPRRVVNMMLNKLEQECPDIFRDPSHTFCDLHVKSGLYIAELARRLYVGLAEQIPDERQRIAHIFGHQLYCFAPTKIIYDIARNYIYGVTRAFGLSCEHIHLEDLTKRFSEGGTLDMAKIGEELGAHDPQHFKFTAIVGNPPYQETIGKTDTQSQGNSNWIYYHFQNAADNLADVTCLIYPFGGWFDAPDSLGRFGRRILSDGHTIAVDAYEGTGDRRAWYRTDKEPQPIFSNSANLSAGVSIVLRSRNYNGSYKYSNRVYSDKVAVLDVSDVDNLSPNPEFVEIGRKLRGRKLCERIQRSPFDIYAGFINKNSDCINTDNVTGNMTLLLANDVLGSAGRTKRYYIDREHIPQGHDFIDTYKVITTSAYPKKTFASGTPTLSNVHERLTQLIELLPKNSAFGGSRIALMMSHDEQECKNLITYTKTNFFAALTLQEPNRRSSFGYVIPDQDFTAQSDIDWSRSLDEIDNQLFAKYGITNEERRFLEE